MALLPKRLNAWLHARLKLPRPAQFFSARWYLAQYPDVARSGENAWAHFHCHGRYEGRFASPEHVAIWFEPAVFERVKQAFLQHQADMQPLDRDYMVWLLARWYALHERWEEVVEVLQAADFQRDRQKPSPFRHLPALMEADALLRSGRFEAAEQQLLWLEASYPETADVFLLRANVLRAGGGEAAGRSAWLAHMNDWYAQHDLLPLSLRECGDLSMDGLAGATGRPVHGPLVSVLMAAYNAQATVGTALKSLLAQTYQDLEIIVVDDGSEDQTAATIQEIVELDARVCLLRPEQPCGPYAARNHALNQAKGEFISVHDADDWSHPQKIACQVALMEQQPQLKACFSNWVRATPGLVFGGWDTPPSWLGWMHRNTSSLLCRRGVFDTLGYWDELRCSCDAEYVHRIQSVWGLHSLGYAKGTIPLAFGRSDLNSLTRLPETHLLTSLKGLRRDYEQAFAQWHAAASRPEDLYMPQSPQKRPFPVSEAMRPKRRTPRNIAEV